MGLLKLLVVLTVIGVQFYLIYNFFVAWDANNLVNMVGYGLVVVWVTTGTVRQASRS
jgi:hypothetical protein